jgi:hypothetical protein
MPEAVRADRLGDPGSAGQTLDRAVGGMSVHSLAVGAKKDRAGGPFTQIEVDRPGGTRRQRDRHPLAALAPDLQGPMAAFEIQVLYVGSQRFGNPKPIEGQQRRQGMVAGRTDPGLDEERSQLVSVPGCARPAAPARSTCRNWPTSTASERPSNASCPIPPSTGRTTPDGLAEP